MIPFPEIDPVIFRIGPLALRWYGMMYLFGFAGSFLLVRYRLNRERNVLPEDKIEDLYFYLVFGLVVGARVGYMFFYNLPQVLQNPLSLFAVWQGGMSFHGGLIGSFLAGTLFCRKNGIPALALADMIVITAPIGLAFGRLGNFINAELWGRVTDVPWAMVFPGGGPLPRHPSQLYELALEGILLFTLLWLLRKRFSQRGQMAALFLMLYAAFRIFVEFFRQPDAHLGFLLFGVLTMGQLLSAAMVVAGVVILFRYRHGPRQSESE